MKKLIMTGLLLASASVQASVQVPYVATPSGLGVAVDMNGGRHPTADAMRDALAAPRPSLGWTWRDPVEVKQDEALLNKVGMYRLVLDAKGKVSKVIVLVPMEPKEHAAYSFKEKVWTGRLDAGIMRVFENWKFRPNKWKQIDVPAVIKVQWGGVISG